MGERIGTDNSLTGILAYDLVPPRELLMPMVNVKVEKVNLGGAKLERVRHETGDWFRIVVDCENMPHCGSCECDHNHYIQLSDENIAAIKGLLP